MRDLDKGCKANRKITSYGTVNLKAGRLSIGARFQNKDKAVFDVQSDAVLDTAPGFDSPRFDNSGIFRKSKGSGVTAVNIPFDNSGVLAVQSGALTLTNGGSSTGKFTTDAGAALQFGGGAHNLAASSSVSGGGVVEFRGGTTAVGGQYDVTGSTAISGGSASFSGAVSNIGSLLTVTGGAASFNSIPVAVPVLDLSGGEMDGSATVSVNTRFDWTGGALKGQGTTDVAPGAMLNIGGSNAKSLARRAVNNSGKATWSGTGSISFGDGSSFNNQPNARFIAQNDAVFTWSGVTARPAFNNFGAFFKTVTTGITEFREVSFNNVGLVDLRSGTLSCTSGFTQTAGSTNLNGGNLATTGVIDVQGGSLAGSGIINGDVSNAFYSP